MRSKLLLFGMAYLFALGVCAWTGYYYYADNLARSRAEKVLQYGQLQTDLGYVDLPRILITMPSMNTGQAERIRMDISLEVENRYAAKIEGLTPRITDQLVRYTGTLDYNDLAQPKSISWLKPDILNVINQTTSPFPVKDVVFRKFLIL